MPTAVPELIAVELKTRLENITTANGYSFDVADVFRITRQGEGWRPQDDGVTIEQGPSEPNNELSYPGNPPANAYDIMFAIHCIVIESDASTTPGTTSTNDIEAAVKKAVANNTTSWHTFGDVGAINAEWLSTDPLEGENGDLEGATVNLRVVYRVSELDPYVTR